MMIYSMKRQDLFNISMGGGRKELTNLYSDYL